MNELVYWIWLSLSTAVGSKSFKLLIERYKSPKAIYECDSSEIARVISSSSKDYKTLLNKELTRAQQIYEFCTTRGVGILTYSDENYPELLREISNPPVLLYYRGKLPDFNKSTLVSVVGTRRLSEYGREYAYKISYDLATSGAIIVSGMAKGVDGVALAGAISAGKPTVAVIGSGIDVCYPDCHLRLAREIVKDGCVITEFPPKTKPDKPNFPKRNRIISALSLATVVIEGDEKSGALITARCAKEQGRAVYALPGNVNNKLSIASSLLIKSGANLLMSADDIVLDFDKQYPGRLNPFLLTTEPRVDMFSSLRRLEISCVTPSDNIFSTFKRKVGKKKETSFEKEKAVKSVKRDNSEAISQLTPTLKSLYSKIPLGEEISVDSLVDSEHPLRNVMSGLLSLEISGLISMIPGDKVKRN